MVPTRSLAGTPFASRRREPDRGIARREMVAVAALGLSLLALAVPAVWVSRARMSAQSAAAPLLRAGGRTDSAGGPEGRADEVRRLRDEVVRLQDERRRLEGELAGAAGLRKQAAASRVELGRFIEAFVVGNSVNWQERSFLIDRGREDGVVLRAGCLEGGAVVGVVVEVGPRVARVAALTEPGVRVASRTLDTRRGGLVVGTGGGCELRYVSRWGSGRTEAAGPTGRDGSAGGQGGGRGYHVSLRPRQGEFVVTSGRLGFFPPGFLVGWIASIGEAPESLHLSMAVTRRVDEPPGSRVWVLRPTRREVE